MLRPVFTPSYNKKKNGILTCTHFIRDIIKNNTRQLTKMAHHRLALFTPPHQRNTASFFAYLESNLPLRCCVVAEQRWVKMMRSSNATLRPPIRLRQRSKGRNYQENALPQGRGAEVAIEVCASTCTPPTINIKVLNILSVRKKLERQGGGYAQKRIGSIHRLTQFPPRSLHGKMCAEKVIRILPPRYLGGARIKR